MDREYGGEVDSFLFHLIGDEDTAESLKAKVRSRGARALQSREPVDLAGMETVRAAPFPDVQLPRSARGAVDSVDTPSYESGIPVILQVRDVNWDGAGIDGFRARSRVGDILAGHADAAAIAKLSREPNVIRIDVSRDAGAEELDVSVPAVRGDAVHVPPIDERGANAIVGVIDAGLDVLHEAFRDGNGNTRIIAYWDQSDDSGPPPSDAQGNPLYGTLHAEADINGMIAAGTVPPGLGRDGSGHGTHVASIAAGRAAGQFSGGLAPEARIIFVRPKLQTPSGDPLSIGYSLAHVDALAFIDRVALNRGQGLPVVVNISLGMNAGAHDGTSTLEAAFDNFTAGGRMPGRVLVKSAGNAASHGLHAHFQIGSEQVVNLQWRTRDAPRSADVIEVWFNSSDDLEFNLSAPGVSGTTTTVGRSFDTRLNGSFDNDNAFSMTLDRFHRDNGDARLSVMITRGNAPAIESGDWTLRVGSRQVLSAGHVDAWIERSRFAPATFITQVSQDGTLSIPGTANSVICVAALDRQMQGQVMSFSSRGSTRDGRQRPDVGAPGNNIVAARSNTANGTRAMPGTSMAAPHVTGAIALLLSQQHRAGPGRQLNANQVRAAISQSARGFNGHWNSARGWGMLDVEALLNLFR